MTSVSLSAEERELVGKCLVASHDGPFFPDWEFHTLFGLTRDQVKAVADAWPDVDLSDPVVSDSISGALNNLLGYPHGLDDNLRLRYGVESEALHRLANRWLTT